MSEEATRKPAAADKVRMGVLLFFLAAIVVYPFVHPIKYAFATHLVAAGLCIAYYLSGNTTVETLVAGLFITVTLTFGVAGAMRVYGPVSAKVPELAELDAVAEAFDDANKGLEYYFSLALACDEIMKTYADVKEYPFYISLADKRTLAEPLKMANPKNITINSANRMTLTLKPGPTDRQYTLIWKRMDPRSKLWRLAYEKSFENEVKLYSGIVSDAPAH